MKKIELDARELEYPIPLQLALKHLQSMGRDEYLYMIHRREPVPLIEIAKTKGYAYLSHSCDEVWHILISKDENCNLEELLDV